MQKCFKRTVRRVYITRGGVVYRYMRDYQLYVEDIFKCVKKIKAYVGKLSFEDFIQDEKTQDAVVRNFEIIGEAARQLPRKVQSQYPDIDWKAMIDFRNIVAHEYFGINQEIVWDVIKNELPSLEKKIKVIYSLKKGQFRRHTT